MERALAPAHASPVTPERFLILPSCCFAVTPFCLQCSVWLQVLRCFLPAGIVIFMLVCSKHTGPGADWEVGGLLTSQHCQERPGAAWRGCPRARGPRARRFRGSPLGCESTGSGPVLGLCDSGFTLWKPWSPNLLNEDSLPLIAGLLAHKLVYSKCYGVCNLKHFKMHTH